MVQAAHAALSHVLLTCGCQLPDALVLPGAAMLVGKQKLR